MALIKEKILDNGAMVSYWKVDMIGKNRAKKEISFALLGYCSKEVADNHSDKFLDCIGVNDLLMTEDKTLYEKYFNDKGVNYKDTETACYMYAKENIGFFKDAVDDKEEVQRREALRK